MKRNRIPKMPWFDHFKDDNGPPLISTSHTYGGKFQCCYCKRDWKEVRESLQYEVRR